MTPWEAPALWPGATVVCIASGPSLLAADVELVRDRARVIVVNDNYLRAPWADALYFADRRWWDWHKDRPEYKVFAGLKVTLAEDVARQEPGVKWMTAGGGPNEPLAKARTQLVTGANGGYQAIGLAVHLGAKRIILLGYDMKLGPKGEHHWFGRHPNGQPEIQHLEVFRKRFAELVAPLKARGIEIVNASRDTALTCFQRKPLADCLLDPA